MLVYQRVSAVKNRKLWLGAQVPKIQVQEIVKHIPKIEVQVQDSKPCLPCEELGGP